MNASPRTVAVPIVLASWIALACPSGAEGGVVARWLGQDGHDLVGGKPGPSKNDYQDIHIGLKGLPPNRELAEVVITGHGSGEWKTSNKDEFTVLVVRAPRSTSADLYIEPYRPEEGREFWVKLKLDNGEEASVYLAGGKADPNLRAPGAGVEARWLGQDGRDRTSFGPVVGPDGFEDVRLAISKLSAKSEIKAVEIFGPGNLAWHSGTNPKGVAVAELVRDRADPTRAEVTFSPGRDLARQTLRVKVTYADDRGDLAQVVAGACKPDKATPKAQAPTLGATPAKVRWLGQDGVGSGLGDVHVVVDGLNPNRVVASAMLGDGVVSNWAFQPDPKLATEGHRLDLRRSSPTRLELAFSPTRDESDATLTLRLVDPAGRQDVIRFPGGPCDPDRRAPALPPGSVDAKPGDDLNALASRAGTIKLAKGVYPLSKPLVLDRPTRIVGEPGAILEFRQGADEPPWTAAIKVHAGGTTLETFAIRFAGPTRWDRAVSFGPSVIGATDDRDQGKNDPKIRIVLDGLDIVGPAASSEWDQAVHSIRLVSATSGKVSRTTIKGGSVLFAGGPWELERNAYKGTLPGTYSFELFAGRYTHDVHIVANHAFGTDGPSGKTWRFLVLSQRGARDLIKDNVVEGGIGPREDDPRPHQNTPEVILTEAYRLHFEGKPAAISADGRVIVIPEPPGGPAGTGDALSILSGPQAGQWRTIVQPLGPRIYLLDEPIARDTDAVSISTGFVRETFEGNTVDCRGSGIAANLVLAGNTFGARVVGNKLLGGGEALRLHATSTEEPIHWGWSHAPFLGASIERNLVEDTLGGGIFVEHGGISKSNKGRVYMSMAFKDNTFRWTRPPAGRDRPARVSIGQPPSLDPRELLMDESGTKVEGAPPRAVWVHAATINGKGVEESPLTDRGAGGRVSGTNRGD